MHRNYLNHLYYLVKNYSYVLKDYTKILELDLSYKTLTMMITAFKRFNEFLANEYGIVLNIDFEKLKEIAKMKKGEEKIDIFNFEWEYQKGIIQEALDILKRMKNESLKKRIFLITLFFTGLRASEGCYLLNNFSNLRFLKYKETVIIELNYIRRTKKAYLTILPSKLFKKLSEILKNENPSYNLYFIENLNKRNNVKTYIFRKSFVAIASNTMQPHEIDLLQGRMNSILVKHYVRHLKEIAEKYEKAFEPYYNLIEFILS